MAQTRARITLKQGKEKPIHQHHPWIFSGAIARVDDASDGDTVDVFDTSGNWLARGYYNSHSQIAVRVWTWSKDEAVDGAFLARRLERSIARRKPMAESNQTNAYRLVNAESDLIPGLIVDRYAEYIVVQFLTLGIDTQRQTIVDLLREQLDPRGIYERSDVDVREKEGLKLSAGLLAGSDPPAVVETRENGFRFKVNIPGGHKTGFYLDQRDNRRRVLEQIHSGGEYLNVFSYTGAFSVYACHANPGVRAINLDASADALSLARQNMELNEVGARGEYLEGDAFVLLRRFRDQGRSFDGIILDPPKFVYTHSQLDSGLRGYKDINLLAIKLLKPGGILITFSCSGLVGQDLFQKVVFGASVDAHRDAQIVERLGQASDHPILLSFPESEYLTGLVCRVF